MQKYAWAVLGVALTGVACGDAGTLGVQESQEASALVASTLQKLNTIFVIVMENHNWSWVKGRDEAPFINNTLLRMASHAENYRNPLFLHPSEPNYIWMEAGDNLGIRSDNPPAKNHRNTPKHLTRLLRDAGIPWKSYQEDIDGTVCPLDAHGNYAPKHNPNVFFDDNTGNLNPQDPYCIAHNRPFSELWDDLRQGTVARYNFLTPNLCNDMHNSCAPLHDRLQQGDTWLATVIPQIMASQAYQNNGVIFLTWDESELLEQPIGMIAVSPLAKGNGYQNHIAYTHSSLLRTVQEIVGVTPLLGDADRATSLSDLFVP
jgi:hypothetical protein